MITVSQTSKESLGKDKDDRGGTKETGSLTDTAGSFAKNDVLDFNAQLVRSKKDKKAGLLWFDILKNRFGDTNVKVPFNIKAQYFYIDEDVGE